MIAKISTDLDAQAIWLVEWDIDRACLASSMVYDRGDELTIFCMDGPVCNTTGRFTRTEFSLYFDVGELTCTNGDHDDLHTRQDRPVVGPALRDVPAAAPRHHPDLRPPRQCLARRATPGRAAATSAHTRKTSSLTPTHHDQARAGPYRPLARPPCPVPRSPQKTYSIYVAARSCITATSSPAKKFSINTPPDYSTDTLATKMEGVD